MAWNEFKQDVNGDIHTQLINKWTDSKAREITGRKLFTQSNQNKIMKMVFKCLFTAGGDGREPFADLAVKLGPR